MLEEYSAGRIIKASEDSPDLEFDTADDEFYRGFQCGQIWACLTDEVQEVYSIVSARNAEMVMRMTEAANYSFQARELTPEQIDSFELGPGEWLAVVMRCNND